MSVHPLRIYDDGLLRGTGNGDGGATVTVRMSDGTAAPLALDRYLGVADAVDESLLDGVEGPVLDVGCGPGRLLHALARRGVFALGVDLSPVAVTLARGRGGHAIVGSVFDELPSAGSWRTALLLDGNIGIGGEPGRLLARLRTLLAPGGEVIAELDPPGADRIAGVARAALETADGTVSAWFPWARVSACQIDAVVACAGGFNVGDTWSTDDRWFTRIVRG